MSHIKTSAWAAEWAASADAGPRPQLVRDTAQTLLALAVKSGDCDLVKRTLVKMDACDIEEIDAFSQGHTPLILCCAHVDNYGQCRSMFIAEMLIDAKANVNLQGELDGSTPLMTSAFLGDSKMVKL